MRLNEIIKEIQDKIQKEGVFYINEVISYVQELPVVFQQRFLEKVILEVSPSLVNSFHCTNTEELNSLLKVLKAFNLHSNMQSKIITVDDINIPMIQEMQFLEMLLNGGQFDVQISGGFSLNKEISSFSLSSPLNIKASLHQKLLKVISTSSNAEEMPQTTYNTYQLDSVLELYFETGDQISIALAEFIAGHDISRLTAPLLQLNKGIQKLTEIIEGQQALLEELQKDNKETQELLESSEESMKNKETQQNKEHSSSQESKSSEKEEEKQEEQVNNGEGTTNKEYSQCCVLDLLDRENADNNNQQSNTNNDGGDDDLGSDLEITRFEDEVFEYRKMLNEEGDIPQTVEEKLEALIKAEMERLYQPFNFSLEIYEIKEQGIQMVENEFQIVPWHF